MRIIESAMRHGKRHLIDASSLARLMMLVCGMIALAGDATLPRVGLASDTVPIVKLAEVVRINIEEVYAGEKKEILSKGDIKRWLRHVTVPKSKLPEEGDFGKLNITVYGEPLSAEYGKGKLLYTGAKVEGVMVFELHDGSEYRNEFEVQENPRSMIFGSSATSIHDAPFKPIVILAVHAEMAHMVAKLYGVKPLISALTTGRKDMMRGAAAEALGVLKDPVAVEPLINMLQEYGPLNKKFLRIAAAEALGRIGDKRAVEPLIDRLAEKELSIYPSYFSTRRIDHYFVRGAAAWALRIITGQNFGKDQERWREWCEAKLAYAPEEISQQITEKKTFTRSEGSSWAVIIGVATYRFAGRNNLSNLIFADDDAKVFACTLRNLGWNESHIKLLVNEDATLRNVMIALESWLSKAGPNDQIVLFWAGHAFPDPEDPEKVYFACYDTDITIPVTGYRMDKVRAALEERKAKNVILLADTCHAGKLITRGDGSRGISIVPNINKMAREQKVPKGWVFMVGADTDRQAIEHTSWANGAFTHSLIKGLSGKADGFQSAGAKDGIVTMGELRSYMNTAMPDETQKVLGVAKRPVITTSTGDPDIWNLTLQVTK